MDKIIVRLPIITLERIDEFIKELTERKLKESSYKRDFANISGRFKTGLMGEAALEILLGIEIIKWTIGSSTYYDNPDIAGLGIGVKTTKACNSSVVKINPTYPEIICKVISDNEVEVCGLATIEVMKEYSDLSLIKDPYLRAKNTKTGFNKYKYLKKFKNLKELKKLLEVKMTKKQFMAEFVKRPDMKNKPPDEVLRLCNAAWKSEKQKKGFITGRLNDKKLRDIKTGE